MALFGIDSFENLLIFVNILSTHVVSEHESYLHFEHTN